MILGIKPKLLILGLLLVCVRKVIPLSRMRQFTKHHLNNINWDAAFIHICTQLNSPGTPNFRTNRFLTPTSEGSGYERESPWDRDSESFDDYDEGFASGWDSSGDDMDTSSALDDNVCLVSGLKSKVTDGRVQLSLTFEELCGQSAADDLEATKKCLRSVCQCFSNDRNYSIHFKRHFSVECVATGGDAGNRRNGNNYRPTVVPRVHGTTWPTANPTRLSPINYDDDDDDDGDEYTVEIDRSRVTELEKEKSNGHFHGIMSKTGLLASIMGGTIIGLLCAVLLAMFIVYRVKKRRSDRHHHNHHHHGHPKSPPCPPLKGYTKNFEECDFYG